MLTALVMGLVLMASSGTFSDPIADLGYAALVVSGAIVLFSQRSKQSNKALNDSIVALSARLDAMQNENEQLRRKLEEARTETSAARHESQQLQGSVHTLERVVTGRDAIEALTDAVVRGFAALKVPAEVIALHEAKGN